MTRKVRCFDIGVGRQGYEIQWLTQAIFPALGITSYEIHGFEAWSVAFNSARTALAGDSRVQVHRLAIADHDGQCRLYMAHNPDGHSIYATKDNVIDPQRQFEDVPCVRLSTWLHANIPDLAASLNILRFNVEGAEWALFNDLDTASLLPSFHICCGNCGSDIRSVRELVSAGRVEQFQEIARRHGIDLFWFCWDNTNDAKSKAGMTIRLQKLLEV